MSSELQGSSCGCRDTSDEGHARLYHGPELAGIEVAPASIGTNPHSLLAPHVYQYLHGVLVQLDGFHLQGFSSPCNSE